jgi:peptidyl-prolyl cis-trans isomerase A (cyclophilin A)
MKYALWTLALTACGNPELEAENSSLKEQLSKLESENKKLDSEGEELAAKLRKAEEALETLELAGVYADLGVEPGASIGVKFHTTLGEVACELMPAEAPNTVLNFVQLAEGGKEWTDPNTKEKTKAKLYDGTIFHRVIPKFMIQGGDPLGSGRGGPGYRFEDETTPEVVFDAPGLLAMANSGPNTNGSQFFITDRSMPSHLNGRHTIFGKCDNLDIVEAIATTPQVKRDKPKVDVVLQRVEITR